MKRICWILFIIVFCMGTAAIASAQYSKGDIVTFGRFEQDNNPGNGAEPIEWQVLAVENDQALLITRLLLETRPYNAEWVDVTWETSDLRA